MPQNGTLILRAALQQGQSVVWREIEIEGSKTLYSLAQAIVAAFGFEFDHAFGFYSGLTPTKMMRVDPRYELFADMGDADEGVIGVEKTKISKAFPAVGHTMMFLFDYGDEWVFRVSVKELGTKISRARNIRGSSPPKAKRQSNIPMTIPAMMI